jgi:hypothetical protein
VLLREANNSEDGTDILVADNRLTETTMFELFAVSVNLQQSIYQET